MILDPNLIEDELLIPEIYALPVDWTTIEVGDILAIPSTRINFRAPDGQYVPAKVTKIDHDKDKRMRIVQLTSAGGYVVTLQSKYYVSGKGWWRAANPNSLCILDSDENPAFGMSFSTRIYKSGRRWISLKYAAKSDSKRPTTVAGWKQWGRFRGYTGTNPEGGPSGGGWVYDKEGNTVCQGWKAFKRIMEENHD